MSKKRILHITPWFPNQDNQIEGVFIYKHIQALLPHCSNEVLYISFQNNPPLQFDFPIHFEFIKTSIDKWRLKEELSYFSIKKFLKKNKERYDIVNFYIAYPNAVKIKKLIRKFPDLKFCITEQWSAYHTNFNLEPNSKGRKRISSIFKHDIPIFVVSSALGEDIKRFSGIPNLNYSVIPNIVDQEFSFAEKQTSGPFTFSSINNWSVMKNPLVLIKAFSLVVKEYPESKLFLAGRGNLKNSMQELVKKYKLQTKVDILDRLSKKEVIDLLHASHVYCQSSNYETFSAICIEALATGTPVIATNIGGMKDFINEDNGILVDNLEPETWASKMIEMINNYHQFDFMEFSKKVSSEYSSKKVGEKYFKLLDKI